MILKYDTETQEITLAENQITTMQQQYNACGHAIFENDTGDIVVTIHAVTYSNGKGTMYQTTVTLWDDGRSVKHFENEQLYRFHSNNDNDNNNLMQNLLNQLLFKHKLEAL